MTAALSTAPGRSRVATATVSGGVATFNGLADDKAETISLQFQSGSLASRSQQRRGQPGGGQQAGDPDAAFGDGHRRAGVRHPAGDLRRGSYGNLETSDNSTVVTAQLDTGAGPLQGTVTAMVSGGVANFTNLADDMAETLALQFTGGTLAPALSGTVVVNPATASKWIITQQPSTTAIAGQHFSTQPVLEEEDQYGNRETIDNSTVVTAEMSGGAGRFRG